MRKKYKVFEIAVIGIILGVFATIVFYQALMRGKVFAWYNDMTTQYNYFYREWYRLLTEMSKEKHLAFYSWNTFLGNDFLATKLFYCVGDPIFIVYILLKAALRSEVVFNQFFAFETIMCIVISGLSFYWYIINFGLKEKWLRIALPVIYALSGFVILNSGSYMFHRFYAFMPLLFYYIDVYLDTKKTGCFVLMVLLLFLQNYECMFTTSVFMVMYFIFASKYRDSEAKIAAILKNSVHLIVSYFVGLLLCGVFTIPLAIYIRGNSRVGSMNVGTLFWEFKTVLAFFASMITPHFNWWSNIPAVMYYVWDHYSMVDVYSTALVPLGIVTLFRSKNNEKRTLFLLCELIIVITLLFKPLNAVVHGFSLPTLRWSFLLIFFNLIVCAYALDNIEYHSNRKALLLAGLFFVIAYAVLFGTTELEAGEFIAQLSITLASYGLFFIYDYCLTKNRMLMVAVMSILCMTLSYAAMLKTSWDNYNDRPFTEEELNYYRSIDNDKMYRYYFDSDSIPPYNHPSLNGSMQMGYMGVTTYDSTYDMTTDEFLEMSSASDDYLPWMIDINKAQILKMLGVKYIADYGNYDLLAELECNLAYNLDEYGLYVIKEYNSIAHTYSRFIRKSDFDSDSMDWNNIMVIDDDDYDLISGIKPSVKKQLKVVYYESQYVYGTIDNDERSVMLVTVPYSTGWTVKDQNYNELKTLKVQGGFLGVILDKDVSEISMYYQTPGLKAGAVLSAVGLVAYAVLIAFERKQAYAL